MLKKYQQHHFPKGFVNEVVAFFREKAKRTRREISSFSLYPSTFSILFFTISFSVLSAFFLLSTTPNIHTFTQSQFVKRPLWVWSELNACMSPVVHRCSNRSVAPVASSTHAFPLRKYKCVTPKVLKKLINNINTI